MSSVTPIITISQDMDSGLWEIYATSYGRTNIAGLRLFRAQPWPEIAFAHATQEKAEEDAAKLRGYLESLGARKGPSKKTLRKLGAG